LRQGPQYFQVPAEQILVALQRGQPVQIGSHTMTFTRAIFVNEDGVVKTPGELNQSVLSDRRAKQAMEVEVKTSRGSVWKAYPKMYQNERTKQMMANPDVQSSFLADLYLSPQAYEPGQPSRVQGSAATVKQKEVTTVDGVGFQLVTFIPDRSKMNDARPQVTINGKFKVTVSGKTTDVTAPLVMFLGDDQSTQAIPAAIPGTAGSFRLTKTLGSDGPAEIEVIGLNPAGDAKPAAPETFTVDITRKPLISLVWGGFYLMMAGGIVAMVRRAMDARQAAIA